MISTQYLFEGYIFSDKTISVDLDKFKSGKAKKLLIVGNSGAGKTTIGNLLAKKFKTNVRSTDNCDFDFEIYEKANRKKKDELLNKYWDCCEKMILDNNYGIIEGVGLLEIYKEKPKLKQKLLNTPCIIIGNSALKSSYRATKRNGNHMFDFHFFRMNFQLIQNLLNKFKKDRCNIKGSVIENFPLF